MDAEFAKKLRETADKYKIKITTIVGVPGHCVWNFVQGPSTIGLVPREGREAKIATYKKMIVAKKPVFLPCILILVSFLKICQANNTKIS